jgi:hypothetical protein
LMELHHFQACIPAPLRCWRTGPCVQDPRRETRCVAPLSPVFYEVWGRGTVPQANGGWQDLHSTGLPSCTT